MAIPDRFPGRFLGFASTLLRTVIYKGNRMQPFPTITRQRSVASLSPPSSPHRFNCYPFLSETLTTERASTSLHWSTYHVLQSRPTAAARRSNTRFIKGRSPLHRSRTDRSVETTRRKTKSRRITHTHIRPPDSLQHTPQLSSTPPHTRPAQRNLSLIPSIPTLMNHQQHMVQVRPLMGQGKNNPIPHSSSTPRRPARDSFDYSGEEQRRTVKRSRNMEQSPGTRQTFDVTEPKRNPPQAGRPFSISDLRRAVCNNLPCFFVEFDSAAEGSWAPSCTQVAIMLKKLFVNNNIPVKELSMCVPAGKLRFKFAVQGKAEFLQLYNWKWPDHIEQKKVVITKPRTLPECLALVVRYIPQDMCSSTARTEIFKAIPPAISFSTIQCQYRARPS